jgi:hypothetical protein
MPQGNNPADDKNTAENRIENKSAEQNDIVRKAYEDVQTLKEKIEKQIVVKKDRVGGSCATIVV